jgi:hypothetical protein
MTLHLLDVAIYQGGLRIEDVQAAGFGAVKLKTSHGLTEKSVHPDVQGWAARTRSRGMGLSTFHWLDNSASGTAQARYAHDRLVRLGGGYTDGIGHEVDCESTATEAIWRDYCWAMYDLLGRPIATYSGRWWWQPRGWAGAALTPYLSSAPSVGYLPTGYPGDASPHWQVAYGGWRELAIMQYAVAPLPGGTIKVSMSAVRDLSVWAGLTGGDSIVTVPDPGNAPPEAWTVPMPDSTVIEVRTRLLTEARATESAPEEATPEGEWAADDGTLRRIVDKLRSVREHLPVVSSEPRGAGEVCAPVISAEMSVWVARGGANSGCVGNLVHPTGFHRGAAHVPSTDYSRQRDPAGPNGFVNGQWSCAGDFRHGGTAALRAMHRVVLAGLMAGKFPMICEMIVQPWPGQPVMYWARWNGAETLRRYTGVGHDLWSHISWTRSRADERANLWSPAVATLDAADKAYLTGPFAQAIVKELLAAQVKATGRDVQTVLSDLFSGEQSPGSLVAPTQKTIRQQQLARLEQALAASASRETAANLAIGAQREVIDRLLLTIESGGGDPDIGALVQRLDNLPTAVEDAAREAALAVLDRVRAAEEAQARALRGEEV